MRMQGDGEFVALLLPDQGRAKAVQMIDGDAQGTPGVARRLVGVRLSIVSCKGAARLHLPFLGGGPDEVLVGPGAVQQRQGSPEVLIFVGRACHGLSVWVKATMVRGIYICGRIVMCREAGRLDFALLHQLTSDRHWAIGDRLGAMILEGRGRASV